MKLVFEVSGDNMLFGFIDDGAKQAINGNVKMTFEEAEQAAHFFNIRLNAQPSNTLEQSIVDIIG